MVNIFAGSSNGRTMDSGSINLGSSPSPAATKYIQTMRDVTLVFLLRQGEVCLGMKKQGFGEGKWNGIGGKVDEGEEIPLAASRELHEEIGVVADPEKMEKVAVIDFHFAQKPEWNQRMHVFFVREWDGEPQESDEMKPEWFAQDSLPYEQMWVDDKYWVPEVLRGRKINAQFHFSGTGEGIEKFFISDLKKREPHIR